MLVAWWEGVCGGFERCSLLQKLCAVATDAERTDGQMDGVLVVIRCGQTDTGCGRRCRTRQSDHFPLAAFFFSIYFGGNFGGKMPVSSIYICKLRSKVHRQSLKICNPAL